ncbi:complement factor H-related protein 5-like [Sceloporus undulatus]|uniref:complement factor H-related protein 5-like n=1 Tax=Sceloporus undulatus TaxID=8520 RepID=UPI001C4BC682|nr:complement factor H-related protein 5-like [Sceloporus undulatus]
MKRQRKNQSGRKLLGGSEGPCGGSGMACTLLRSTALLLLFVLCTAQEAKQCEYPRIQNGQLYYNEPEANFPKREGHRLYFRCNNGFLAANKNYWQAITCTKNGWNPEPKCFKKCDPSQQIQHGRLIYLRMMTFIEGNEISVHCDMGYYPANQQTTFKCTNNGWSPTPRCVAREVPCTTSQEDMQRNNIRFRWSRDEKMYSESGARIEFTCRWPYDPAPSSPPFIVQCIDGTFEYPQCI